LPALSFLAATRMIVGECLSIRHRTTSPGFLKKKETLAGPDAWLPLGMSSDQMIVGAMPSQQARMSLVALVHAVGSYLKTDQCLSA